MKNINKTILILGAGMTGRSLFKYAQNLGLKTILVDSRKIESLKLSSIEKESFIQVNSKHFYEGSIDEVWMSSSYPPSHPWVICMQKKGIKWKTDIEIFFERCLSKIILITGTNGKSTVTHWLSETLNFSNYKAVACGNFGLPVLDALSHSCDFFVVELSSFQLHWARNVHSDCSILLNISPDHMDWHGCMKNYIKSKEKVWVNSKIPLKLISENDSVINILSDEEVDISSCFDVNDFVGIDLKNRIAAKSVLASLGLSIELQCPVLEHRGEVIIDKYRRQWVNNSKATNLNASIQFLKPLIKTSTIWWLIGGVFKENNLSPLNEIQGNINLIFYGKDGFAMKSLYQGHLKSIYMKTLKESIDMLLLEAMAEDTIVLAPACASFDEFNNFEMRGRFFKDAVSNQI